MIINIKEIILDNLLSKWKNEFVGISTFELSLTLCVSEEEIIKNLDKLVVDGKACMSDKNVAFPSREALGQVFKQEGINYGEFTNRLHKGDSQIKHYYFKQDVLGKYFRCVDRYHIYDDVSGGCIRDMDSYYFSLSEEKREQEIVGNVRYGKRKLKDGSIAIAVIVYDLSLSSKKEQMYWVSFEFENPEFSEEDPDFEVYWKRNFKGHFIAANDPLQKINNTIKTINALFGNVKLFGKHQENLFLKYPVVSTQNEYQTAHKELYKWIGSDSLNKKLLEKILIEKLSVSKHELCNDRGSCKGQWALFKMLVSKIHGASFEPFQRCHDARVETSHKIAQPQLPSTDLRNVFLIDCYAIQQELCKLRHFLETVMITDGVLPKCNMGKQGQLSNSGF